MENDIKLIEEMAEALRAYSDWCRAEDEITIGKTTFLERVEMCNRAEKMAIEALEKYEGR